MSEQLQLRRGTAAQVAAFTGAQGEIAFDTTTSRLFSNDGATVGGFPVALETVRSVSDVSYAALITDRQIAFSSLTAPRVVTLPAAGVYPAGATLSIIDESGACSATLTITTTRSGSDTINGSAVSAILANAFSALQLQSNGLNGWTIVNQTTPQVSTALAQGPAGSMTKVAVLEQLVSGLSGASVVAATQIPAGALVLACSARVVTAISGATSFEVGYAGSLSAFGSGLGVAAGSTNEGLIGPNPFYSATNLILTPAGGSFTAGAVRLSLSYLIFTPPTS